LRTVYFSRDYSPHDHRFLTALAATEHEVYYLRLERSPQGLESRPIPDSIKVVDWWGGRRRLRLADWPRAMYETRRTLRSLSPDLVHAGPVQSPAFLTAVSGGHPLLTMSWGSDLLWKARSGWGRWAARWTLRRSDAFTCDCDAVRRRAVALGAAEDRIFVFPWGVDLDRFQPGPAGPLREQSGFDPDDLVLLSTRPWEPFYGVPELVEAFVQAAADLPALRLWMIGRGSLRPSIERQLQEAGLTGHVRLDEPVTNEQMPAVYRASDLYLSASHGDGSSVSLMEAMACGLPALVSDIPGNREWVLPGDNGWWFTTGSSESLAGGLRKAVEGREALEGMGARSRTIAELRADWDQNFKVLMQAYEFTAARAK